MTTMPDRTFRAIWLHADRNGTQSFFLLSVIFRKDDITMYDPVDYFDGK